MKILNHENLKLYCIHILCLISEVYTLSFFSPLLYLPLSLSLPSLSLFSFLPSLISFYPFLSPPSISTFSVGKLFASVPLDLPDYMQNPPRCTDIVELPYSMASLDHLEPIMYRNNFRTSLDHGEKGLKKVSFLFVKLYNDLVQN